MRIIGLCLVLLAGVGFAQDRPATPAACGNLADFRIAGVNLEVTSTQWVPARAEAPSRARGYAGPLPAYCRVEGVLNRRTGVDGKEYGIGFAIALPEGWNGGFLMLGGGGLNGSIPDLAGGPANGGKPGLARGFAVAGNDTGHKGTGAFDASFRRDQQAVLDFAYVANGRVAEVTKLFIAEYYGRTAAHSYFMGCSTGGREAMIMTQRYPTYFDGVVSGAPAMRTGLSNLATRWARVAFNRIAPKDASGNPMPGGALSETDRKLVIDALVARCDARDGIADGMIFDVAGCDFDPAALACGGAKNDSCLSAEQVAAIKKAFAGPTDSRGFQVYPGFPFDTGINAKAGIPGLLSPGPSPVGGRRGPELEQDVDREAIAGANPLGDPLFTNLSTFSGRGGKLVFFHGVSDPWFSAFDTLDYYRKMSGENGGPEQVLNWSRYFMVPGMGHCGGGEATLDQFDMLTAISDWVEKGIAPDSVVASGRAFPGRTRPLCPYPKFAHYTGTGDPENAANYECRE